MWFCTEWSADVDAYVVHTNYDEYALVVMFKQQRGGNKTTSVKLYGEETLISYSFSKVQHRWSL